MILTIVTIIMAYIWLLKETNFLRVNLAEIAKPEPFQHSKHNPKLDEPLIQTQIKTLSFPKLPKMILVISEHSSPQLVASLAEIGKLTTKLNTRFIELDDDEPMYKVNHRNRQERRLVRKQNMSY